MNWDKIHIIYFVGIGGIGMSALARYFKKRGKAVSGYDRTKTPLTEKLEEEGIAVQYADVAENLPEKIDLAIYTPAIPAASKQLNALQSRTTPMLKRAEVLGFLSKDYYTIAVAGSHGKTSISAMLAHLLKSCAIDCEALLGGISLNYNSNYIAGNADKLVVEADEYDRSFHRLNPNAVIISSIDTDHLDVYGSKANIEEAFGKFASQIDEKGLLVKHFKDVDISSGPENQLAYGIENEEGPHVSKIEPGAGQMHFTLHLKNTEIKDCKLKAGAVHNIENMLAAALVAEYLGANPEKIKAGIASFKGVKRRFEQVYETNELVLIDDYAHHPKEIEALISALRKLYTGRKIHVIFQPHLYSRTRDLAAEFATALTQADYQYLLPVYPARETPIEGVESHLIADQISGGQCRLLQKKDLIAALQKIDEGVIATVGAGDIDQMVPKIKAYLQNRKMEEQR